MMQVKKIADKEIIKNRVYSLEEAAVLLGISETTMRRRIKDGTIPGAKIGRQYRIMGVDLINSVRKGYRRYKFE